MLLELKIYIVKFQITTPTTMSETHFNPEERSDSDDWALIGADDVDKAEDYGQGLSYEMNRVVYSVHKKFSSGIQVAKPVVEDIASAMVAYIATESLSIAAEIRRTVNNLTEIISADETMSTIVRLLNRHPQLDSNLMYAINSELFDNQLKEKLTLLQDQNSPHLIDVRKKISEIYAKILQRIDDKTQICTSSSSALEALMIDDIIGIVDDISKVHFVQVYLTSRIFNFDHYQFSFSFTAISV